MATENKRDNRGTSYVTRPPICSYCNDAAARLPHLDDAAFKEYLDTHTCVPKSKEEKLQPENNKYKNCKKLLIECIQADTFSFFEGTGGMPDLLAAKQYIDYISELEKQHERSKER